jgi:hypothetical protein
LRCEEKSDVKGGSERSERSLMVAERKRGIDGEVGGILVLKMILQLRGREGQL